MSKTLITQLKFPTKVTIAAGGTPQSLSPGVDLLVHSFVLLWAPANAGDVYVGESDVTSDKCIPLSATTPSIELGNVDENLGQGNKKVVNLRDIYIDGTTGDIVYLSYLTLGESRSV